MIIRISNVKNYDEPMKQETKGWKKDSMWKMLNHQKTKEAPMMSPWRKKPRFGRKIWCEKCRNKCLILRKLKKHIWWVHEARNQGLKERFDVKNVETNV